MKSVIYSILETMADKLDASQMKALQECLIEKLENASSDEETKQYSNQEYLDMFLAAKKIEGCSERTLHYYRVTAQHMLDNIPQPIQRITTEDLRQYLTDYQKINNCSQVTINNIRRNLSSLFSWLEEENYILKNPIRRIHKVRTGMKVKETFSDETLEKLRDGCTCMRDLAMIDFLNSTGVRVGELVNLNRSDIDFEARECIVYGNGMMKDLSVLQEPPFTDRGSVVDIFTNLNVWNGIRGVISQINDNASVVA